MNIRVEALTTHQDMNYVTRNAGDQYDCEDRYALLFERIGRVRRMDMQAEDLPEPQRELPSIQSVEEPVKRRRGRPPGSGVGHYKRRDLRVEE